MTDKLATFPRSARLSGAAQFTGVFARRYRSDHFLLLVRAGGSNFGSARLGIVIGRKQVPRAVDRAKLRRSIREAFRRRRHDFGQVDMIVRYRSGLPRRIAPAIHKELTELFKRTGS